MMLGGVGFQAGLDEVEREQMRARRPVAAPKPDVVAQIKELKALLDDGVLTPEEFRMGKRKVLES
jgi:putative oligomerization/nucleic acid binding protein